MSYFTVRRVAFLLQLARKPDEKEFIITRLFTTASFTAVHGKKYNYPVYSTLGGFQPNQTHPDRRAMILPNAQGTRRSNDTLVAQKTLEDCTVG